MPGMRDGAAVNPPTLGTHVVKRLSRIMLNSATMVSFVLCVATVTLWMRSRWVADSYYAQRSDGFAGFESERGTLRVFRNWQATIPSTEFPKYYRDEISGPAAPDQMGKDDPGRSKDWRFEGVRFYTSHGASIHKSYEGGGWTSTWLPMWCIVLPYWCPALLLMLAPAHWIWKWRRHRRF